MHEDHDYDRSKDQSTRYKTERVPSSLISYEDQLPGLYYPSTTGFGFTSEFTSLHFPCGKTRTRQDRTGTGKGQERIFLLPNSQFPSWRNGSKHTNLSLQNQCSRMRGGCRSKSVALEIATSASSGTVATLENAHDWGVACRGDGANPFRHKFKIAHAKIDSGQA